MTIIQALLLVLIICGSGTTFLMGIVAFVDMKKGESKFPKEQTQTIAWTSLGIVLLLALYALMK